MFKAQQGFTLIELMIVVAIIGVIAAIAIPQLNAFQVQALNASAAADLKNLNTLVSAFASKTTHYPNPTTATGEVTLTDGTTTDTMKLSSGVSIILEKGSINPYNRCLFSKHINGDTIMYANTTNLSVIDYAKSPDDTGKVLADASAFPAIKAIACNL